MERLVDALQAAGLDSSEKTLDAIRLKLAESYANYTPSSQSEAMQPVDMDIALIHWSVLQEYGLPPSTFGGTPFGGWWAFRFGVTGAHDMWPYWCTTYKMYQPNQ